MLVLNHDPQGIKVVHKMASAADIERLRTAYIRGAESMIIALPADANLPAGKQLARRPQLQVDCTPIDPKARKCRVRHGWGYASGVIDRVCVPICAMAVADNEPEH